MDYLKFINQVTYTQLKSSMHNFYLKQNFSSNKSKFSASPKTLSKYQITDLQVSPWESEDAQQLYLGGQIQNQIIMKDQCSNAPISDFINKNKNQKRSSSQHYNRNGIKTEKDQTNFLQPYVNKLEQIIIQRCRSSSLYKKNKSAVVCQTQQPQESNIQCPDISQQTKQKQILFNISEVKTEVKSVFKPKDAFRHVVNTTYLTFYDQPNFTPFQKNKRKMTSFKKNFYTIQTESKSTKKESTSFKNFQHFLKMKKLEKFQSLSKKNQDTSLIMPIKQNFMINSPQKDVQSVSSTNNYMIHSQIDNNKKNIGKMFEITQIPKQKFSLYLKTEQTTAKLFRKEQVNLLKLQKESQCLLRMKSQPSSPTKNRNQRLYTTQAVINAKGHENYPTCYPNRVKKMISTNIQKIKKSLKIFKENDHYKKVDQKILQIKGGKYSQKQQS